MELLEILKNPKDKLLAVDLDWTLCTGEFRWEWEPLPIQERIDYINWLYKKWAHIIIYTARSPEYFTLTFARLIKYWVKHHWICMQYKPGADIYLDDRCININDIKIWK